MADAQWVLLAYRLPREPSSPRVTVWRKLRRLGAIQLVDGLVALPANAETTEALGWLADEVVEAGGESWTWLATGPSAQHRALRRQLRDAVAKEYADVTAEAKAAAAAGGDRATAERLRRVLREIERRDHSRPKERDDARRAVQRVVEASGLSEAKR